MFPNNIYERFVLSPIDRDALSGYYLQLIFYAERIFLII